MVGVTSQFPARIRQIVEQKTPPEVRLKALLRLVRAELSLHNLTLIDRSGPIRYTLHAIGHRPGLPLNAAPPPVGEHSVALPLDNACELLLLFPHDRHCRAALDHIAELLPELSAGVRALLNDIRSESDPVAVATTRLIETELSAELGRAAIEAADAQELLQRVGATLLRFSGAVVVVLRELADATLLGMPHVFFRTAEDEPSREFIVEEERRALQTLMTGTSQIWRTADGLRIALVVPLSDHHRQLGSLTLVLSPQLARRRRADLAHLRQFFSDFASFIGSALARFATLEQLQRCCSGNEVQLHELSALYRLSRGMQKAPRLNELIHFLLSAACVEEGGSFERAMIFLHNERTAILQGMLGVTRESARLVLPSGTGGLAWEHPQLDDESQRAQRQHPFCREVMKQRLPLQKDDNPLARCLLTSRVIFVPDPTRGDNAGMESLTLGPFACIPLPGKGQSPGVIVVDNPVSRRPIGAEQLRFLELFAGQAGAAMANALLIKRLETAHSEVRESHEQLVQGEKLALLGEMAATLAHEVRTPLVAIGGFARRLVRLCEDEKQRDHAAIIAREASRLENLLGGILAFSRKQLLCFGPLRAEQLLDSALQLEHEALANAGISVRRYIAADLPELQGDKAKLKQVLINLMANARQAMPGGGILTLRAHTALLRGSPAVAIEIEDSGPGIAAENLTSIFRPFFTTRDGGTGLGLAISASIIEQHRGELTATNAPGGALFRLLLPV